MSETLAYEPLLPEEFEANEHQNAPFGTEFLVPTPMRGHGLGMEADNDTYRETQTGTVDRNKNTDSVVDDETRVD